MTDGKTAVRLHGGKRGPCSCMEEERVVQLHGMEGREGRAAAWREERAVQLHGENGPGSVRGGYPGTGREERAA